VSQGAEGVVEAEEGASSEVVAGVAVEAEAQGQLGAQVPTAEGVWRAATG
jgi:hypothetical protein